LAGGKDNLLWLSVEGWKGKEQRLMPVVDVKVYYLEMLAHNHRTAEPLRDGLAVVGKDYHWYSRGKLPHAELAATVQNPLNEVHVLHADGVPAGFAELVRR
jgi:hypothetical protein